jgi:hypothetical protein
VLTIDAEGVVWDHWLLLYGETNGDVSLRCVNSWWRGPIRIKPDQNQVSVHLDLMTALDP